MPIKQPQDRKTKATKTAPAGPVTFTGADGTVYELPDFNLAAEESGVTTREFAAAVHDGSELALTSLNFRVLEGAGVDEELVEALYDLPMLQGAKIAGEWFATAKN